MSMGIYKITNKINGKVYIGQSVNIQKRWIKHKSNLRLNKSNTILYYAFKKYGIENFLFEIIEECTQQDLNEREIYWIKYYDSTNRDNGYNISLGGDGTQKYNYEEIYNKWKEGKMCKDIMTELSCNDKVITNALRAFGISEKEAKSRVQQKNSFVALSKDGKPLKVFYGQKQISLYFTGLEGKADTIPNHIKTHHSLFGYYWDYLNENNYPEKELTDEEFLSYRKEVNHLSKEQKTKLSMIQRTVERPSRELLKELIRTKSFIEIGKMYGVSDNSIRKWCDFENLPRKKTEINKISDEDWTLI